MNEEQKERSSPSPDELIRIKIPKERTIEVYVVRTEDGEERILTKEELERLQKQVEKKEEKTE